MTKGHFASGIACALAIGGGAAVSPLKSITSAEGHHSGLEVHDTHASASLLGQFRTSISGWLWVRTDLYLHNGVVMRPLTEAEEQAGREKAHSDDGLDEHMHGEAGMTTVIPGAEHDFRGIFGDLDRAAHAYKSMKEHSHNSPKQTIPLFRLMTWLDPSFVPGWTTGGAVMAMGKEKKDAKEAIAFLRQGQVQNPGSVQIASESGYVYLIKLGDISSAERQFSYAVKVGKEQEFRLLSEDEQDSLQETYRWLALIYRNTNQPELQRSISEEGLKLFPKDGVLRRLKDSKNSVSPKSVPTKDHEPEH